MIHGHKHKERGIIERMQHQRQQCNMEIRKPEYATRLTKQITEQGQMGRRPRIGTRMKIKDIILGYTGEFPSSKATLVNVAMEKRGKKADSRSKGRDPLKHENMYKHAAPAIRDSHRQDNLLLGSEQRRSSMSTGDDQSNTLGVDAFGTIDQRRGQSTLSDQLQEKTTRATNVSDINSGNDDSTVSGILTRHAITTHNHPSNATRARKT
jgi:hypothetical protein